MVGKILLQENNRLSYYILAQNREAEEDQLIQRPYQQRRPHQQQRPYQQPRLPLKQDNLFPKNNIPSQARTQNDVRINIGDRINNDDRINNQWKQMSAHKKQAEEQKKSVPACIAELLVGCIPPVEENTLSHLEDQKRRNLHVLQSYWWDVFPQ